MLSATSGYPLFNTLLRNDLSSGKLLLHSLVSVGLLKSDIVQTLAYRRFLKCGFNALDVGWL